MNVSFLKCVTNWRLILIMKQEQQVLGRIRGVRKHCGAHTEVLGAQLGSYCFFDENATLL